MATPARIWATRTAHRACLLEAQFPMEIGHLIGDLGCPKIPHIMPDLLLFARFFGQWVAFGHSIHWPIDRTYVVRTSDGPRPLAKPIGHMAFGPFGPLGHIPFGLLANRSLGPSAYAQLGFRAYGPIGHWTSGLRPSWASGPSVQLASGALPLCPIGLRALGPQAYWPLGPLAISPSGYRPFGPIAQWTLWPARPSVLRALRCLAYWSALRPSANSPIGLRPTGPSALWPMWPLALVLFAMKVVHCTLGLGAIELMPNGQMH